MIKYYRNSSSAPDAREDRNDDDERYRRTRASFFLFKL